MNATSLYLFLGVLPLINPALDGSGALGLRVKVIKEHFQHVERVPRFLKPHWHDSPRKVNLFVSRPVPKFSDMVEDLSRWPADCAMVHCLLNFVLQTFAIDTQLCTNNLLEAASRQHRGAGGRPRQDRPRLIVELLDAGVDVGWRAVRRHVQWIDQYWVRLPCAYANHDRVAARAPTTSHNEHGRPPSLGTSISRNLGAAQSGEHGRTTAVRACCAKAAELPRFSKCLGKSLERSHIDIITHRSLAVNAASSPVKALVHNPTKGGTSQ